MKCCIVTLYNSENCGSYLQAYALKKTLEDFGYSVVFYKRKSNETEGVVHFLLRLFKQILTLKFHRVKLVYYKKVNYKRALKNFIIENGAVNNIDTYILGSDTIWDITVPNFKRFATRYWGMEFRNKTVISYAPSVGWANDVDFKKFSFIGFALSHMSSISVRDSKSYDIIKEYTDKNVEIVCDPTFLLDKNQYNNMESLCKHKKYILLYYYGQIETEIKESIKEISEQKNLSIISLGVDRIWCDISIPNDPFVFLSYYHNADYIITNTFHGAVFSIIYNKEFISSAINKDKVTDLLNRYNLSHRLVTGKSEIKKAVDEKIDYGKVNKLIEIHRSCSLKFLKKALSEGSKNEE